MSQNGKGSARRPTDEAAYRANYDAIDWSPPCTHGLVSWERAALSGVASNDPSPVVVERGECLTCGAALRRLRALP